MQTRNQVHRHESNAKPAGSCGGYFFPKLREYPCVTTGCRKNYKRTKVRHYEGLP